MDRLEELKNKYQAALATIQQKGAVLAHLHVQDNKLFIQGAAPSEDIKNEVWNQIKAADASFSDLTCDLTVDPACRNHKQHQRRQQPLRPRPADPPAPIPSRPATRFRRLRRSFMAMPMTTTRFSRRTLISSAAPTRLR